MHSKSQDATMTRPLSSPDCIFPTPRPTKSGVCKGVKEQYLSAPLLELKPGGPIAISSMSQSEIKRSKRPSGMPLPAVV